MLLSDRAQDESSGNVTSASPGQGACCHFAGHPVFCCKADWRAMERAGCHQDQPLRHMVRLERRAGADRLGFGNIAAGPRDAPVLVVSWIRDGALLADWNSSAPDGLKIPPQTAIVAVNGVAGDVTRMREQLRAQVVDMEVVAPDRWKWERIVQPAG